MCRIAIPAYESEIIERAKFENGKIPHTIEKYLLPKGINENDIADIGSFPFTDKLIIELQNRIAKETKQNDLARFHNLLVAHTKTSKDFHNIVNDKFDRNLDEEHDLLQFSVSNLKVCMIHKM